MPILKHKLSNGLQILCDQNMATGLISIGYFVGAGSRDESAEINGVSHFLEHMCFKGTEKRSALEINQKLDDLGANSNARTSEESTVYHATVLPDFQDDIADLFTDMMRPALRSDDFQTEKKVILEEIAMYKDQPPFGGNEQIMADFFQDHPLSRPILGTVESVEALSEQQMRDFHDCYYSPNNMVLSVSGPVDFDRLVKQIESLSKDWTSKDVPSRNFDIPAAKESFSEIRVPSSTQQYGLRIMPGVSQEDPKRYALRLASMILGDDSGSRLFWKLVDPGLVDIAAIAPYEYQQTGILYSFLVCRPEDFQSNWETFQEVEKQLVESGPTDKEVALAKSKAISSICMAAELNENRMFDLGGQFLAYGDYETPKQITEKIQAISKEEIQDSIQQYFSGANSIVTVGP